MQNNQLEMISLLNKRHLKDKKEIDKLKRKNEILRIELNRFKVTKTNTNQLQ